ncbi:tryptophan synthase beta subunit-like PLP-dependent enzyme [Xylariaceae sp. FL0804]|nr:tryptophan synthase beta subunit-like PLP-dependent enzyme [Xylariaceae sp. FL0804]
MGSYNRPEPRKLYIETPCIPSAPLSRAAGCNIFLKLENLQPSGSFKSRGIGSLMRRAQLAAEKEEAASASASAASAAAAAAAAAGETEEQDGREGGQQTQAHFYCSSGGNAGLACATAALALARPCTVVVPATTPAHMLARLRALGADVHQVGENWAFADRHLREELLAKDPAGVYVPPFDHPHIWEGAATIVDELVAQTRTLNADRPRAEDREVHGIVCNCGGGGLLNGIMEGVERNYADNEERKPRVLAVETEGTASLAASIAAGELVTLPKITGVATSLGAPRVSERTFRWATEAPSGSRLRNVVVSDAEAVKGSLALADEARLLVEVACGATVAPVYSGALRAALGAGLDDAAWAARNVVLIVCGGSLVSLDLLAEYRERFGVRWP